jgi:ligand-binding SRPBCC domain-containing protein
MKQLTLKEERTLRKNGGLKDMDGQRIKSSFPVRKPKASVSVDERQALALERLVAEIKQILSAKDATSTLLLEIIKKIKTDVTLETPKPISKWKHTYTDLHGNKKTLISEAV